MSDFPKHFLSSADLNAEQYHELLTLAARLKSERPNHNKVLESLNLGIYTSKPSLRTRMSFEVGINELGGKALFIRDDEVGLGTRESYADAARVFSRYLAAIIIRSNDQAGLIELSEYSDIPVINALTDKEHPCQILADMLTLQETFGKLKGLKIAYIGDGNNVTHSLMIVAATLGLELNIITPPGHEPDNHYLDLAQKIANESGHTHPMVCNDPLIAQTADVIYADVWQSMGQGEPGSTDFTPYQVNADLIAGKDIKVLHCLPAHKGEEITEDIFEANAELIFRQAENRLHAQKALIYKLFS